MEDNVLTNIIPIIILVLVAGLGFWLVTSVGLPFLEDPDTFEPLEVVEIQDTDEEVIINLTEPDRGDELELLVDGARQEWGENNTVRINKSNSPVISLESYPEGQGLYERYEYPLNESQTSLNFSDEIVTGASNTYGLQTTIQNISSIRWFVNGELQASDTRAIDYTFDSRGEQQIQIQIETDNIQYTRNETLTVFEPGEVVLDINATSTDLVTFESFDLNITEETSQNVEEVDIDWDNGENTTLDLNETTRYWYREAGSYNITVSGNSTTSDATVTQTLQMNVSEREDPEEISRINLNVFDRNGDPVPNATVSVGSIDNETDNQGFVRFRVQPDEYQVLIEKEGYVPNNETVLVRDTDVVIDTSLERIVPDLPEPEEEEEGLNLNNTAPDYNETVNETEIPSNTDVDSLTLETFNSLNGTGTQDDPYLISDYIELQSIRVQPTAYYELTEDIDASISLQQDTIEAVENETIGDAEDRVFYLPYVDAAPEDLTINVGGETIDEDQYRVEVTDQQSITGSPIVSLAFVDDGSSAPPEELFGASAGEDVTATYPLPEEKYRGFDPIDAQNSIINLDGNGYEISNLLINRPFEDDVGLVTNVTGGQIRNVVVNGRVRGYDSTGGIVGSARTVTISSVEYRGVVQGQDSTGGLIGRLAGGQVTQAYNQAGVQGDENVGGVIGSLVDTDQKSVLRESYSLASIATPTIGHENVGGLVGSTQNSDVQNSYSQGYVIASRPDSTNVGGIVGGATSGSQISSVYAATPILTVESESDTESTGGIAGSNSQSTIETGYWNSDLNTESSAAVGISEGGTSNNLSSRTTTEMTTGTVESMGRFDFDDTWQDSEGSYPSLRSEFEDFNLTVVAQETNDEQLENPIITIINSDGEEVRSEELESTNRIESTFELTEGQYTVRVSTAAYESESEVRLVENQEVSVLLNQEETQDQE